MRDITADDLEALATGAWILGTGGGGNPYMGLLNMRELYRDGRRCRLMAPDELDDGDAVAVVSAMGAPLVGRERLKDPRPIVRSVEIMQAATGVRFRALMSLEVGGGNAFQPFLAAALMGLPVVDADCMGRAFPEGQMTSFAVGGLSNAPMAMADIRDNEVVFLRAESWTRMERMARRVCVEWGSTAATCLAPRTGREVKDWGIPGTTSRAIALGRAVAAARAAHTDPVAAIVEAEGGRRLFVAKVRDVARRTTEGFLRGTATLEGLDADRGRTMTIDFQNEFAVAWADGEAVAMTPDLICVIDSVDGEAVGTEMLRYGQRVSVVVLPAPPVFLSPDGLALVGPRAFGHDLDFRSAFEATADAGD